MAITLIFIVSGCSSGDTGAKDNYIIEYDIKAESTSQIDVETAINSAETGDTVLIPQGESVWEEPVSIPNDKKIILRGYGKGKTIIVSNMASNVLDINSSGSRVTGIHFKLENNSGICIAVSGTEWRIDNCYFENIREDGNSIEGVVASGDYTAGDYTAHPVGVIDHCEFYNIRVLVVGSYSRSMQNNLWNTPLALGTNNAVFVEDCDFVRTHGNAIDSNHGGRYVFRYNTVYGAYIEAHAVQGDNRSARSWEIYENDIIRDDDRSTPWVAASLRGGTGVIFNNRIKGTFWNDGFAIDYRRAFEKIPFDVSLLADGSHPWDGNNAVPDSTGSHNGGDNMDVLGDITKSWEPNTFKGMWLYNISDGTKGQIIGNTETTISAEQLNGSSLNWNNGNEYEVKCGYPGRDQIGCSRDVSLWTDSDPYPSQEMDPAYCWNNTYNDTTMIFLYIIIVNTF